MPHRIILFRGMNTGGVRAPVGEQRAMAVEMGLGDPRTLQASGNLVVESGVATEALETAIEAEMARRFDVKIAAMARTPAQWAALIAANPFVAQAADHPSKVVAMIMKDGIRDEALDAVQALCRDGEAVEAAQLKDGGDVLYFWFPHGQGDSEIFKKATPKMLGMGTGRNWNTVLKLAEMAGVWNIGLDVKNNRHDVRIVRHRLRRLSRREVVRCHFARSICGSASSPPWRCGAGISGF